MRASNNKFSCRVYMVFNMVIKKLCVFPVLSLYSRDQDIDHIRFDLFLHSFFGIKIIMLG